MAGLEFDLQQFDKAREYASQAIRIAPSEWLYHFLLGSIEKGAGNAEKAQQSFDTAAQLNPRAAPVQNALGELALNRREWKQAVVNFERASQLEPQESLYRQNLETARTALQKSMN
jgi:Tfp pilus assembly protein PilF